MNMKKSVNLIEIVIDEVALEGLDGITLEGMLFTTLKIQYKICNI